MQRCELLRSCVLRLGDQAVEPIRLVAAVEPACFVEEHKQFVGQVEVPLAGDLISRLYKLIVASEEKTDRAQKRALAGALLRTVEIERYARLVRRPLKDVGEE